MFQSVAFQCLMQCIGRFKKEIFVSAAYPVEFVAGFFDSLQFCVNFLSVTDPHTQRANVPEHPRVEVAHGHCVSSAHGQSGHGAAFRFVYGTEMLFYVRNDVFYQ